MKIFYDTEVDVIQILLRNEPVDESGEEEAGIIFDYDKKGNIVGIEILNASKRIENPGSFEALGYDSVGLVAEAVRAAGIAAKPALGLQEQRAGIRDALVSLKNYKGATGAITMQESGDPLKSLVILKYDRVAGKIGKVFVKVVNT